MPNEDPDSAIGSTPLVSVTITAFNSEKFLAKALDSVLMQEIDFPMEIVIGDDRSTDGTVALARGYERRYPHTVRVFEQAKNVGVQRNTVDNLGHCRGKYVACLDADDSWTNPQKLARQVALLEADPSLSACCHYVRHVTTEGTVALEKFPAVAAGRHGLEDLIRGNFLPTSSVVFRNGVQRGLPPWYFEFTSLSDWPIWILAALSGDIVLMDAVDADYLLAHGSSFMSKGRLFWSTMEAQFYGHIEDLLPRKWRRLARFEKGKRYEDIAYRLRLQGDFTGSREAAMKAFRSPALLDSIPSKSKALLAAVVRETQWKLRGKPERT